MAADIADRFQIKPKLIVGSQGIFDVEVDGNMIFSKHAAGRFPEHDEVLSKIGEGSAST